MFRSYSRIAKKETMTNINIERADAAGIVTDEQIISQTKSKIESLKREGNTWIEIIFAIPGLSKKTARGIFRGDYNA